MWNVDGFEDPPRHIAAPTYLWEQRVNIAILTETYPFDEDICFGSSGDRKKCTNYQQHPTYS